MKASILVVEDSTTQALALRAILEDRGFAVERAASGEEALERLARETFDLVVSDIVMPGMTGYDLCRRIKDDGQLATLPVVLLTSLGDPVDIVRGLECGADNYVTKPYDPEQLTSRIRNVLDRKRLRLFSRASMGVNVSFLGTTFSITSDKEQILDLFISSVEDVVRANTALQESQRELASAKARLETYASQVAEKARASEERYSTLMHEANDAIFIMDVEGRILEANARATELFGRPVPELRGMSLADLADTSSGSLLRDHLGRLSGEARVNVGEIAFERSEGGRFICDVSASQAATGNEVLVFAILHDVTALKQSAVRLQKSEALLAESQRFAQLGSWEHDLATGTTQWTVELYRIFGFDPTQVVPSVEQGLSIVHPADAPRIRAAYAALEQGEPFNMEYGLLLPDGTVRVVHGRAEVLRHDDGRPRLIRGTVQDITERKHLEEQLQQSQKIEAIGQLAGGIAHDFNNMLTVIISYCGIILSELPHDSPLRDDLGEVSAAADRAAALTRQLLAFSRRQVLQPRVVDVNDLTTNLEKLLRRLVREDIEFVTELDPDIGVVWADPGQLEQVLMNLVVNARDAMPNGGSLTLRTAAVERTRTDEFSTTEPPVACVMLEVTDTGTGMTPEVRQRIFEPFFTTKPVGQGTGLGLATVYGIVQQSGGTIELDSAPDEGTTFRIYLPCSDGQAPAAAPARRPDPAPSRGETVLIVEDDAALRSGATRILRRRGYDVLEAANGREALQQCERHHKPVDLVLTDVVMPEMSGYELGREMARQYPATRILFMSGYSRDAARQHAMPETGMHYLDKPFTIETLVAKVEEALTKDGG